MPKQVDSIEAAKALGLILEPGQVTELRAIDATTRGYRRPHTESGYFDDHERLIQAAATLETATGIYFVPNIVKPSLLARAANRARACEKKTATTSDHDIERRRWLLVDFDAIRPADISTTDDEHKAALTRADAVMRKLQAEGWPWPIMADSGNGAHLLYRIDEPSDDAGLVQRCLEALASRFDDDAVKVDRKVFNPARIWKLYGTWACKGDDVPDRPHRLARVLWAPPAGVQLANHALLLDLGGEPKPSTSKLKASAGLTTFDVPGFIARHALSVGDPKPYQDGQRWEFTECPWNSEHKGSAFIIQFGSGAISAGCHHNSCSGHNWRELREMHEPPAMRQRPSEPPIGEPAPGVEHETRTWSGHVYQPTPERMPGSDDDRDAPPAVGDETANRPWLSKPGLTVSTMDDAVTAWSRQAETQSIPSPIGSLNEALAGGFPVGQVTTLVAYTGGRKTEFARQSAMHAALNGHTVIHVDVELGLARLYERTLSQLARVPPKRLRCRSLRTPEDEQEIAAVEKRMREDSKIHYICPSGCPKIEDLCAVVESLAGRLMNGKPPLIILDSAQRLAFGAPGENPRLQMTALMHAVEAMAHRSGCAVILVSEQKRSQDGKAPSPDDALTSGAESRAIEFVSDVMIALVPEDKVEDLEVKPSDAEWEDRIDIMIAKNRLGSRGYLKDCAVFVGPCWGMRCAPRHAAKIEDGVLGFLGDSEATAISATELAKLTRRKKASVLEACRSLRDRGLVLQTGAGSCTKWFRDRFPRSVPVEGNRSIDPIGSLEVNRSVPTRQIDLPIGSRDRFPREPIDGDDDNDDTN